MYVNIFYNNKTFHFSTSIVCYNPLINQNTMHMNRIENLKIDPRLERIKEEEKILESLRANVSNALFPLIEEFFQKGIIGDEEWILFRQELLRMITDYLPYKKQLDESYGEQEKGDIFTSEIKTMLENKINKLFNSFTGSRTATERDQAEIVYKKLEKYISSLNVKKL